MKKYVNASLSKRFGAFLLDVFTILFTATLLYTAFGRVLVKTKAFTEATKIMNTILVESYLYEYDEEDKNITRVVKEDKYAEVLEKYYSEVKKDTSYYYSKLSESNLFDLVDGVYIVKDDVASSDVKSFYEEMMGEAIIEIKSNEDYQICYRLNMNFVIYNILISFMIAYFGFILVVY